MTGWYLLLDGSRLPAREDVGSKARGLALMRSRALPVPPAFALPTRVGRAFNRTGSLPAQAWEATLAGVAALEAVTGQRFGESLLVSVRSGAARSMPGMLDTILNVGIDAAVQARLAEAGGAAFAQDTHARLHASFRKAVGTVVPEDPHEQLRAAISAVCASWESRRARAYRRHHAIPDDDGTAVIVQAMVFGNLDDASGTGVLFTRNPLTGAREPYGEFLPRGQGEDVVSGAVPPLDLEALRARLPEVHAALLAAGVTLERELGDVQDVEFTVQRGRLYLLQTRSATRSLLAGVRFAVDLVEEGLATPAAVLTRVRAAHIEALRAPIIAPAARLTATRLAQGVPACPGVVWGRAVDCADEAAAATDAVILLRRSTAPEDVPGMIAARGIATEIGGTTSHAAVVSRELGRPAVVGCGAGALVGLAGRTITLDGATGELFAGMLETVVPSVAEHPQLARLAAWAQELGEHHPVLD